MGCSEIPNSADPCPAVGMPILTNIVVHLLLAAISGNSSLLFIELDSRDVKQIYFDDNDIMVFVLNPMDKCMSLAQGIEGYTHYPCMKTIKRPLYFVEKKERPQK